MADFNFFLNRQGIQGRKGEKGDTGFSPTISVGTDTLDEYKLIIANESNSFETPNLRGNINIQDNGGTYLRYDTETKQISAQSMDAATADTIGGVRLSTEADIVEMGAESVVTPSDVADALPLYLEGEGAVTITQDELTSKTKIKVDVPSVNDLESRMSTAEAEIADIQTDVANLDNNKVAKTDLATTESAGIVKVDGTSITVTADGTISASSSGSLPIASTTQLGGVKVDGTSIIADENGVISSVGGGGAGDVTASGNNVFTGDNEFKKNVTIKCDTGSGNSLVLVDKDMPSNSADLKIDTLGNLSINSHGKGINLKAAYSNSKIDMSKDGDIWFTSEKPLMHLNLRGSGTAFPLINQDNIKAGENITLDKNAETGDITISSTGGTSTEVPIATTEIAGKVKPDGTTITVTEDGTISAVSGGGSAPANMVTTDTAQDITGKKTIVNSDGLCLKSTNSLTRSVIAQIVNTSSSVSNTIGKVTILPDKSSGSRNAFARISYGILNDGNSNFPLYGKGGFQVTPVVDDTSAEARILLGDPYNGMGNIVGTTSGLTIGTGAAGSELSITSTDITFNGQSLLNSGGETPTNMVTTDSDQIINGTKIFANGTGTTFTGTSSNSNSLTIDADDKEIRFNSANSSDAVIKNQGWNSANLNIGTNFNSVKITTTLYDKNGIEIVGGSGGGSAPENMVTTDTVQDITAYKTFSGGLQTTTLNASTGVKTSANIDLLQDISGYTSATKASIQPVMTDGLMGINLKAGMSEGPDETGNYKKGKVTYNGTEVLKNDLSNISDVGSAACAHYAMPSTRYKQLTIGATGSSYEAPVDGWFCFVSTATTAAGQYCRLINKYASKQRQSSYASNTGQYVEVLMPVSKGQTINVYYTAPVSTFSFIYAEGSPSE